MEPMNESEGANLLVYVREFLLASIAVRMMKK